MTALVLVLSCLQNPADGVDVVQRLGETVPLDLPLRGERGEEVRLGEVLDGRPAVLLLVYYRCPMLCGEILNGTIRAANAVPLAIGDDYRIATVSFAPEETPDLAAAKKGRTLEALHDRPPDAGWRFLTGDRAAVDRLLEATGFRVRFDPSTGEYAHGSAVMVLTPDGRLARYFFGVEYPARDLRLALVEASRGEIGSLADKLLLLCLSYDPARGRYSLAIMKVLRLSAGATAALVIGGIVAMRLRERRRRAHGR